MIKGDRHRWIAPAVLGALELVALLACEGPDRDLSPDRAPKAPTEEEISGGTEQERWLKVPLPTDLAPEEAVVLRFRVQQLPFGSRVVVSSKDGEALGAIAPFGQAAYEAAAWYEIPVAARHLSEESLRLHLRVEDPNAPRDRAPTNEEIPAVEVIRPRR